jgi:hypothetical protein
VHYGALYSKQKPFKKFVSSVVKKRVEYSGINAPAENRAKFTLNSAIGKFGMNLERQLSAEFIRLEKLWFNMRTPYYRSNSLLDAEGRTDTCLLKKKKRRQNDSLATHISLFVYQQSKLHLYEFIQTVLTFFEKDSFKLTYIGKKLNRKEKIIN